ncbi:MAG: hypothetical protein ACRDO2_14765 [Nocardioidaceae bacterium]
MTEKPRVDPSRRAATRRSLHGVAELVLAGPQYRTSGSIELRVTPGGFATTVAPDLRVEGLHVVAGDIRAPLEEGRSYAELAATIGVTASRLDDVYADGPGLGEDEQLDVEQAAAAEIAEAFRIGGEAMRMLAPAERPILWPEHFDVGITVARVNYGLSPGDAAIDEPYAYVGPWEPASYEGAFWNAPFGAAQRLTGLGGVAAVLAFFREGQRLTS